MHPAGSETRLLRDRVLRTFSPEGDGLKAERETGYLTTEDSRTSLASSLKTGEGQPLCRVVRREERGMEK
jgi:hypothetical protein